MSAEAGDAGPPVTVFGQTVRLWTFKAGTEVLITEPGADPVRIAEANTDPITINVAGYKKIRFQCPVQASTVPEGTRLAIRGLPYIGAAFVYLNAADEGPWLPLHAVNTNTDGAILPVISDWFVIDDEMDIDNLTLEHVIYGGDGTGEVVIGNVYVELSADARPPTSEIPEPPVPTSGLLGDWPVDEGLGGIVSDVSGNDNDLSLGLDSPDDQDPTWVGGDTHGLQFGAGSGLHLKYAINATLPYSSGELRALSLVWYMRFSSLPAGEAWIFRLTSSGGGELQIRLKPSGAVVVARGTDGGPLAIETAALSVDTDYVLAYTNEATIGGAAKLYVNAGTPVTDTMPGPVAAFLTQPNFYWGTDNEGFTSGIGLPGIIGHTRLWDGVITGASVAATYVDLKTEYPGLP